MQSVCQLLCYLIPVSGSTTFSIIDIIFREEVIALNLRFLSSSQILSEKFLFLKSIQREIINIRLSVSKITVILVRCRQAICMIDCVSWEEEKKNI